MFTLNTDEFHSDSHPGFIWLFSDRLRSIDFSLDDTVASLWLSHETSVHQAIEASKDL